MWIYAQYIISGCMDELAWYRNVWKYKVVRQKLLKRAPNRMSEDRCQRNQCIFWSSRYTAYSFETKLEEKMDRWMYLNELNEKIQAQK